jgi:hypothetical protein
MFKKLKIVLSVVFFIAAIIMAIYIGIYNWNHDSLTKLQMFKIFYKEYFVMLTLFLSAYFMMK